MEETIKKLNEEIENKINEILQNGIPPESIENLYKLVDIHKDIANENYWKEKIMRYGTYGRNFYGAEGYGAENYGARSYGRRGVDAKYRGEQMMDEMAEHYGNYMESASYNGPETIEALKYMLKSAEDFFSHIKNEAKSQEEIELVRQSARKISEM